MTSQLVVLSTAIDKTPGSPPIALPADPRVHLAVDGISLPGAKRIELHQLAPDPSRFPVPPRFEVHAVFGVTTTRPEPHTARLVFSDDLRGAFDAVLAIRGLTAEQRDGLADSLAGALNSYLAGRFAGTSHGEFDWFNRS